MFTIRPYFCLIMYGHAAVEELSAVTNYTNRRIRTFSDLENSAKMVSAKSGH